MSDRELNKQMYQQGYRYKVEISDSQSRYVGRLVEAQRIRRVAGKGIIVAILATGGSTVVTTQSDSDH